MAKGVIKFFRWLKDWKPLHWCWWFEKHGLPIPPLFIGGGDAAPQYEGSRISDASRSWQADEDLDVTGWTVGNAFCISVAWGAQSGKKCNAREVRLRWRNVTDAGSFADLGASGELTYSATTNLVNDDGLTEGESGLVASQSSYVAGVEREGANAFTYTELTGDTQWTACMWAVDTTNALAGKQYEFELYNQTDTAQIAVCSAQITMAAGTTQVALNSQSLGITQNTITIGLPKTVALNLLDMAIAQYSVTQASPIAVALNLLNLALNSQSPTVSAGSSITTGGLSMALTITSPTPSAGSSVSLNALSLGLGQNAVTVSAGSSILLSLLDMGLALASPTVSAGSVVVTGELNIGLTTYSVSVSIGGADPTIVSLNAPSISLNQFSTTVSAGATVALALQNILLDVISPTVLASSRVNLNVQSIAINQQSPTIGAGCTVITGELNLGLTTYSVTITIPGAAGQWRHHFTQGVKVDE